MSEFGTREVVGVVLGGALVATSIPFLLGGGAVGKYLQSRDDVQLSEQERNRHTLVRNSIADVREAGGFADGNSYPPLAEVLSTMKPDSSEETPATSESRIEPAQQPMEAYFGEDGLWIDWSGMPSLDAIEHQSSRLVAISDERLSNERTTGETKGVVITVGILAAAGVAASLKWRANRTMETTSTIITNDGSREVKDEVKYVEKNPSGDPKIQAKKIRRERERMFSDTSLVGPNGAPAGLTGWGRKRNARKKG